MGRGRRAGWGTVAPLLYSLFIDSLLEHLFSDLKHGEQPVTSRRHKGPQIEATHLSSKVDLTDPTHLGDSRDLPTSPLPVSTHC